MARDTADLASSFNFATITPHDSTNLIMPPRGIYVGTGGDVVAVKEDGTAVTFVGMLGGCWYPLRFRRINSTSTTAQNLVALY